MTPEATRMLCAGWVKETCMYTLLSALPLQVPLHDTDVPSGHSQN